MAEQVPEQQKAERSDMLLELTERMSGEYRKGYIGREKEVLMEEKVTIDGTDYLAGHTKEYIKAAIPWEEGLKNRMVTGVLDHFLTSEIISLSKIL